MVRGKYISARKYQIIKNNIGVDAALAVLKIDIGSKGELRVEEPPFRSPTDPQYIACWTDVSVGVSSLLDDTKLMVTGTLRGEGATQEAARADYLNRLLNPSQNVPGEDPAQKIAARLCVESCNWLGIRRKNIVAVNP